MTDAIQVECPGGAKLQHFANYMCERATEWRTPVVTTFNLIKLVAYPGEHFTTVCDRYFREDHARTESYKPFDFKAFVREQMAFSADTFGPGARLQGVTKHIEKEVAEVRACEGRDVSEWADIIILAVDGAWRSGHSPEAIADALAAKLAKNKARTWPDWRTASPDAPIEHVKGSVNADD